MPPRGADRILTAGNAVVVLDSASAIEPTSVPPGIYADHLGASIMTALAAEPSAALADAIGTAARMLGLTRHGCCRPGWAANEHRPGPPGVLPSQPPIDHAQRLECHDSYIPDGWLAKATAETSRSSLAPW